MQELKLTPQGLRSMTRRSIRAQVLLISIVGVVYIVYLAWSSHGFFSWADYMPVFLIALVYGFLLYNGIRRSKKVLAEMTFLYDGTSITRKLPTTRDMTIHFLEVSNVSWHRNGLLVTGLTNQDQIWIPQDLEHFSEIEAKLAEFLPEDQRRPEKKYRRTVLTALNMIPMVASIAIFALQDTTILLIAGIIFIATAPVVLYNFYHSKVAQSGRKVYVTILFAVIFFTLLMKLGAAGPVSEWIGRTIPALGR